MLSIVERAPPCGYCPVGQDPPSESSRVSRSVARPAGDARLFPGCEHRGSKRSVFLKSVCLKLILIDNPYEGPEMNASKLIATAALSLLAVAGAQAETYEGV